VKIHKIYSKKHCKSTKPKPGDHIDTQLFPECKGTEEDRDVSKKNRRRKKASEEVEDIDAELIEALGKDPFIPVESSFIESIAYFDIVDIMEVKLKSGKRYTFFDVPPEDHRALMESSSKGIAFNEFRKRHRQVPAS
jgi:hypothetical protein